LENNYYDILEINKNASPEIIEKAYKVLIKKYHPDLQENNLKIKYEEKIKKINEAYETLSNPEKRKNYDLILKNNEISIDEYNKLYNENIILKKEINYLKNNYNLMQNNYNHFNNNYTKNNNESINKNINEKINNAINKAYLKNFIALFFTIIIILIVFIILWNIPFTKNYFINLYNQNSAFKFIVDIIINIFK